MQEAFMRRKTKSKSGEKWEEDSDFLDQIILREGRSASWKKVKNKEIFSAVREKEAGHRETEERDGNGRRWSFHKCKGTAADEERSKGERRKALNHEVLIQVSFWGPFFFKLKFGAPKFRTINSGPDLMEQAKLGIQKVHHLLPYLSTYLFTYLFNYLIMYFFSFSFFFFLLW